MKRSIKEPIPEIFQAWDSLNRAVDAHLMGDTQSAHDFFKDADSIPVRNWLNPGWSRPDLHVVTRDPAGDTREVPNSLRDPDRNIAPSIRAAVLKRDGYRCRYCGIPVVSAEIRKLACRLYPDAIPWEQYNPMRQHAGFACLWLQFDHVVPHSHGGRSSTENVVISCALCNFGKDKYTLLQLNLSDPREYPPVATSWDGLERFKTGKIGLNVLETL